MYAGFFRLITLPSGKTAYHNTGVYQELLLHQLPLTMLIRYNLTNMPQVADRSLERTIFVFTVFHVFFALLDLCYFKNYLGMGINLDLRVKFPPAFRIQHYFKYFCLSMFSLIIIIPVTLRRT